MPSFAEAVTSYIDADRALLNTAIPAKVLSYDPVKQSCVVIPLIKVLHTDETTGDFSQSPMEDVPVMFPGTSSSMFTFPIEVNSTVLLVFSQRSIDSWLFHDDTDLVNPEDFRKHDIADAIAIPGLFSFPRAINNPKKHTLVHATDDLVIAHNIGTDDENEFRLKKNGTIEINTGTASTLKLNKDGTVVLTADTSLTVTTPTANFSGDINATGTITADVDVVADGISLKTHTHDGSPTAPSGAISPTGEPV